MAFLSLGPLIRRWLLEGGGGDGLARGRRQRRRREGALPSARSGGKGVSGSRLGYTWAARQPVTKKPKQAQAETIQGQQQLTGEEGNRTELAIGGFGHGGGGDQSRLVTGNLLMEVLGRQPCKREEPLGWEGVHESSAHHLFDTMPSPLEMFEEDILLVMNEEKVTQDEAVHLLQKELRDAQCRMDEKLDCLLEMFGLMGDKRSKEFVEFSTSTRELIPITEAVASPPYQESPSSAPTKCSTTCSDDGVTCLVASPSYIKEEEPILATALELGDRENKAHAHYIYNCDSTKVMLTKCSTVGLDVKGGIGQAEVMF
uniref:Uncharacterized protein n=1 Tax=Oryza glumipatula TaxID=40148 RepID=A0A0D9YAU4_9ORYZ